MNWSEFRDTASRLAQGLTEGDWRSAISRSYYAIFHFFRDYLLSNGLDVGQGGQAHFNLYSGLLNCGIAPVGAIASRIDRLRELRVRADYELGIRVSQRSALSAVLEADAVVADFQALLGTASTVSVVDGARRHLQAIGRIPRTP